jgi:hypothetical protein
MASVRAASGQAADGDAGTGAGRERGGAWLVLAVVVTACVVTLVVLGTRLTFFNDDWQLLLQRPGLSADSLLRPHNGHLTALTVLVYKALAAVFGLGSQVPFRLVLAAAVAAVGVLVYVLVSERCGRLPGLVAATLVMFLGAAWEDLLFVASISQVAPVATGLGALLALERDTPGRNAVACLLLVCSVATFDVGLAFVVAAGIAVLLRRRPSQLWIAAVPVLLFGAWWLGYGGDVQSQSHLSVSNVEHLPRYVFDSVSSGLASLVGLNRGGLTGSYAGGLPTSYRREHIVLLVAAIGVAVWLYRGGRPSSWLLVYAGAALSFWALAGANYFPGREPFASRYQLVDATLLMVIAAELFRGVRLARWPAAAVLAAAAAALGLNLVTLHYGFRFMRDQSAFAKADIGALEIARGIAPAGFQLTEPVAHNPYLTGVTAERYFAETAAHGSPSHDSPAQLLRAPRSQRQAADRVLVAAYRIAPRPSRRPGSRAACRRVADTEVALPSGGVFVTNLGTSPVTLGIRRFAPAELPLPIGPVAAGATVLVAIPRDRVAVPWRLSARGSAYAVCPV